MTAPRKPTSRPKSPSRTAARARSRRASRSATWPPHRPRRRWRKRHEGAERSRDRRRRRAARGRGRLAVVRRGQGGQRRLLRHPQGGNPRHHRAERRRQDLDAQRHQRLLSSAARPHHLQGPDPFPDEALRGGGRRHRPHLPERRLVPRHDRARQHHGRPLAQDEQEPVLAIAALRPGHARGGRAPQARRGDHRLPATSRKSAARRSAGCLTACRSASSLAARSPWSPSCFCSTSRWPA